MALALLRFQVARATVVASTGQAVFVRRAHCAFTLGASEAFGAFAFRVESVGIFYTFTMPGACNSAFAFADALVTGRPPVALVARAGSVAALSIEALSAS